jgi:tRNA(Ile)-lysidine synthase
MAYLDQHRLTCRQDASNLEPWCQRNLLRLEVIPRLHQAFNSNLNATLLRTARIFREEELFWESFLQAWLDRHASRNGGSAVRLPITPLLEAHPAVQRRLLRRVVEEVSGNLARVAFRHSEILLNLCRTRAANRSVHLPGELVAEKSYHWLTVRLRRQGPERPDYAIPGPGVHALPGLNHVLEVQCLAGPLQARFGRSPFEVFLDRDRVSFPLSLRFPRPGDRFRPLGLGGSKKLKDLFIDLKVPRSDRAHIPVLTTSEHLVWVVGYRLDDRVKITPGTTRALRLCYRGERGSR